MQKMPPTSMLHLRHRQLMLALVLLQVLLPGCLACFSGSRQTAKVDENPMTEWSQWSDCDLPCGDAKQTRWRARVVLPEERELQSRPCGVSCAEAFDWSPWQDWSNCSLTCGPQGVRSRYRNCRRIADGFLETHRMACPGDWVQAEACNTIDCPPVYTWTEWSDWTQCTSTCGPGGQQERQRKCQTDRLVPAEPDNCGDSDNETRACNEEVPCPTVAEWQPWSEWSGCSVTCGPANVTRTRERRCPPDQRPNLCIQPPGDTSEVERRDCGNPVCPAVNGGWAQWNPWSNCLVTCGWGFRVRNRLCNSPPPSNGGADCVSTSVGYERCLGGECPVNGDWGPWTPCNNDQGMHCVTKPRGECMAGTAMYCRLCDNPKPEFGGTPCVTGHATERRDCWNTEACDNNIVQPPLNFMVVGFLNTSDLLVTWTRAPFGLSASSFFITWTISDTDTRGDIDVPVVPQSEQKLLGESYSHWIRGLVPNNNLEVTIATRSTAGGLQRISQPLKDSFRVSRVDGVWGEWGSYDRCSPTQDCDTPGTRSRSRQCDSPAPVNGGKPCPGSATENSRCYHPCN